jgi:hypothetical protein
MVTRLNGIRGALVAAVLGAALLLVASPTFAQSCSSILGSPDADCSGADTGYINATARVGTEGSDFSDGELQLYFGGSWHYYGTSDSNDPDGSGTFDCPDGGTVEYWANRYNYIKQSDLVSDAYSFNVKMVCKIDGNNVFTNQINGFTFNCP